MSAQTKFVLQSGIDWPNRTLLKISATGSNSTNKAPTHSDDPSNLRRGIPDRNRVTTALIDINSNYCLRIAECPVSRQRSTGGLFTSDTTVARLSCNELARGLA